MTPPGSLTGPRGPRGSLGGAPAQSSTVTTKVVLAAFTSRKKAPGSALTIEESVPTVLRLTKVTNLPPCLLTSAMKIRASGWFVFRVVVMRKNSPLMLKTDDCLLPLPLVMFTTLAPGHSESGPVGTLGWRSR